MKPEGESAYVPSLGPDETREILAVRIPLEKLAFKLAAEKMTPEDLGEIEEVMETKAKDVYHFDYLFHEKIWETSGNRLLLRHLVQLVKPLFIGGFRVLNHDNTIKEHREIFRILKNQEAEEVQKAVGKHIANAWMTETGASLTAAAASP